MKSNTYYGIVFSMDQKQHTVYFAKTNFRGVERTFGIRTPDRRQHMYVVGKTGTGKTNLLKNVALQDIANGAGVAIVDPHGAFVEEVLPKIPEHRLKDVIYINPADADYPIGFNVFEVPDPQYKHLVASDLIGIFTKIWANVWSARMEYILGNCILALLDTPGTTLLGIPRILVDKDFRRKIIDNVKDPVVRSFWVQEYESWEPRFRNEAIVPIQNKVGQFLSTPMIRNIVGQPKSAINIYNIMNEGKILLVNVSKGRLGEDNSKLLGAMLITKIQLAAMERVRISEEERKDFYLYVDEFQNFATNSFADILSEARKYRLNIIIAHQYIGQLVTDQDTKVRDAVYGNVGTMIVFRVGATDAEFLEKEFEPEFQIQDLVNLPNFNIYLKLMVNGLTSRPFSAMTIPAIEMNDNEDLTQKIVEFSRSKYGKPRAAVEEDIAKRSGVMGDEEAPPYKENPKDTAERYAATCSICGKSTHVSFKPDGKRPVYCSSCLRKVQSGEISPPSGILPKLSFGESLGALGIEFEKERGSTPLETRKPPVLSVRAGSPVLKPVSPRSLSLGDLSKMSPPVSTKRGPDMAGLKRALKDALGKPQSQAEKDTSVLKPGEAVKL